MDIFDVNDKLERVFGEGRSEIVIKKRFNGITVRVGVLAKGCYHYYEFMISKEEVSEGKVDLFMVNIDRAIGIIQGLIRCYVPEQLDYK